MRKIEVAERCTKCNGTGLYGRHTSYTVNGKPICFKCNGVGQITRQIPSFVRLYKVRLNTSPNSPFKLVPASKRKHFIQLEKPSRKTEVGCFDEIPF